VDYSLGIFLWGARRSNSCCPFIAIKKFFIVFEWVSQSGFGWLLAMLQGRGKHWTGKGNNRKVTPAKGVAVAVAVALPLMMS